MARYIPTDGGDGVVDASADKARIMSIRTAEGLLQHYRRYAWDNAANGSGYVANYFNTWANSLSDALTYAEELRGEGEKKERVAA